MAAQDSDGEEDFVTYGKPLEPYEEGEQQKRPTPLQDQAVKDEKGRYKRFHGAFTGGFSAGYFNTVGSKEGWAPATFVSSRQGRSEKQASRPEDFMDEEDLGEFGIAPKEIVTTDDFASKAKDKIREKARELAAVTAPIPGATILEDLIAPAKITVGVQLLRQMGWKEGQGVGPRTKRKVRKQEPGRGSKVYGCALPPTGSEGSEEEEDDEYLPENVTFAPKDVTPIDFTIKDDVHGLGYRGLDPRQALFGSLDSRVSLFGDGSDRTFSSPGNVRHGKGRKVGISGQAFGVGALEDEDDDIYGTDSLSKYDTVLREEESGDGLFGWTAPKEYKNKKDSRKELQYLGKVLEGFSISTQPSPGKKVYLAPELPRDYKPIHYFRPVINAAAQNSAALQALLTPSQNPPGEPKKGQQASRHQLSSSQRRDMLGEEELQGPASVMDLLSDRDREKIRDVRQTLEEQRLKAQKLAQEAMKSRFQAASADETRNRQQDELLDRRLVPPNAEEFRPFQNNPEKQKRYEIYIRQLHQGQKDSLESCLDSKMTEWERSREREEFMRSAMLYKPSNSSLSSRFTRGKHQDDSDSVEVPRDQEGDTNDKSAAVKMKMFGRLTRDRFEWHPDKVLCKRFNIPDPYPGSTLTGLPKVKRDKYSVFNFLTIPEPQPTTHPAITEKTPETSDIKQKKSSRWDVSSAEEKIKDPLSDFLSNARCQSQEKEEQEEEKKSDPPPVPATASHQNKTDEDEEEEQRPPIDLFKAIFADSSDEKTSSSEEESDEDPPPPREEPEIPPPSILQAPELRVGDPVPPAAPAVTGAPHEVDDEEEFGPRLPPALPSATLGISSGSPSLSRGDPLKKPKQKRHKEKHKQRKEPRHKKEKKKKHKKQKHKNKHKNKKESDDSTDSADSSADLSDTEEAAHITPRELLKRLKNLPIPR